ncbi:MAG TPA: PP0621 family protein [Casimicrobiaceae bacterium]|nr:PP0621 family protein [Casimicrobiaceae bacterium]
MIKIIAWIILIFVVLFALRMIGVRNARRRARAPATAKQIAEPMVRCLRCGIFLPRNEARAVDGGFACASGSCAAKS